MNRTTEADLAEMRSRGFEAETIAKAERDLVLTKRADALCHRIEEVFSGVVLGEGIGLWQAQGIDDHEDEEACQAYRERDEKDDWRKISSEDLNECNSSPSFLDEEGFRFLLPAFLCSELRGEHGFGFEFTLVQINQLSREKFALLSPSQRAVVREYLQFLLDDPEYGFQRAEIERALAQYWTAESCA